MSKHHLVVLVITLLVCGAGMPSQALTMDSPDRDFHFSRGLIKEGFPDFADKIVRRVLRFHPEEEMRAKLLQTEIAIARGKLTDAEKVIESMDSANAKTQAARLALANAYYARGNNPRAQEIYEAFFKQSAGGIPEDEELRGFYRNAAYRFSQMQERKGNTISKLTVMKKKQILAENILLEQLNEKKEV